MPLKLIPNTSEIQYYEYMHPKYTREKLTYMKQVT